MYYNCAFVGCFTNKKHSMKFKICVICTVSCTEENNMVIIYEDHQ